MDRRRQEACYQAATWFFGCHLLLVILITVVGCLSATATRLIPGIQGYSSLLFSLPLAILFSLPAFLYCQFRYHWLSKLRIHGAEPAPVHIGRDRILGRDHSWDVQAALKEHRFTDMLGEYFARSGSTHWVRLFHTWILQTRDPEIVKAMYATQDADWEIGGARKASTAVALGRHSIFAINGPEWKHTRALMRPSFVRNQIADLECTDRHTENFLRRLPRDGSSCIDVQDLLYKFTMDISTDFM